MRQRAILLLCGIAILGMAQAPPAATMQQLMLDLIHPASNDILLFINRGAQQDETGWASVRRSAVTLAESANLLALPGRAPNGAQREAWMRDAQALAAVGAAAYKAAQAKDAKSLAALAEPLDRACTTCHQQFRPNVFPRSGGSQ